MGTFTVQAGQYQLDGRADLGTIEGCLLLEAGKPRAVMFDALDARFYGAEKQRELRATYRAAKRTAEGYTDYHMLATAWVDSCDTRLCLPL